jgi:hypothetical protein
MVKRFTLNEADYYDAYIQNRRYGWNARDNYVYKAEIRVPGEIHAGKEVTQRTDFKPVEILANADITFRAETAIYLEEGFEIKEGATFLAEIVPYYCENLIKVEIGAPTNDDDREGYENRRETHETEYEQEIDEQKQVVVYPNPSDGTVNLKHKENKQFSFWVYDLSGKETKSGINEEQTTNFSLPKGIYIIKTQTDENTEIHRFIVR